VPKTRTLPPFDPAALDALLGDRRSGEEVDDLFLSRITHSYALSDHPDLRTGLAGFGSWGSSVSGGSGRRGEL